MASEEHDTVKHLVEGVKGVAEVGIHYGLKAEAAREAGAALTAGEAAGALAGGVAGALFWAGAADAMGVWATAEQKQPWDYHDGQTCTDALQSDSGDPAKGEPPEADSGHSSSEPNASYDPSLSEPNSSQDPLMSQDSGTSHDDPGMSQDPGHHYQ